MANEFDKRVADVLRGASLRVKFKREISPSEPVFSCNEIIAEMGELGSYHLGDAAVEAYSRVYFPHRMIDISDFSSSDRVANNQRETALAFAAAVIESGGL